MKKLWKLAALMVLLIYCLPASAPAVEQPAANPATADKPVAQSDNERLTVRVDIFAEQIDELPLARVNDENIVLRELVASLGAVHMGAAEGVAREKQSIPVLLDRLINSRLIIQEARSIGLDKLPEIEAQLDVLRRTQLRGPLLKAVAESVKVDEQEVEKRFRRQACEVIISALYFDKESDARVFAAAHKKGGDFTTLMEKAVSEKKAKGGKGEGFVRLVGLNPKIAVKALDFKTGVVSPVIPLEAGFAIFRIEDRRFPENAELRTQAEEAVRYDAHQKALVDYRKQLEKKYMKIDRPLLKSLDFEVGDDAFAKLAADQRVIAAVKGGEAVTVADLAKAVREKFYHGVSLAMQGKKVNRAVPELFETLCFKRLLHVEALNQGLDKSKEYQTAVREAEESILFGLFVEKVLKPEVKVDPDELEKYYQEHIQEFTSLETIRFESLAFASHDAALSAVDKLTKGVAFKWLQDNADGKVEKVLSYAGETQFVKALPEDLRRALAGVQAGDARVYDDGNGTYFALNILDVTPAVQLTLEQARSQVVPPVYRRKIQETMDSWTVKLRAASEIEVYLVD